MTIQVPTPGSPDLAVVVTCEHAGNHVPLEWRHLFAGRDDLLASHRGWDPGAAELAQTIAARFGIEPLLHHESRLLVEINRSLGHPALFSKVTRRLDERTKSSILERHYRPHRERVQAVLEAILRAHDQVLHLAVHTFTPVFDGRPRAIDVASLDDPRRVGERGWTDRFLAALHQRRPLLRLARNRPYRGWADGLTTTLRAALGEGYLGIELEVSQAFPLGPAATWRQLQEDIAEACREAHRPATC